MARADFAIARIEGHAHAGGTPEGNLAAGTDVTYDTPGLLGPGTIGRRTTYIAAGTFALLFLYWRAAKGY